MNFNLLLIQVLVLAVLGLAAEIDGDDVVIHNPKEFEEYLRNAKMGRETKQVLKKYRRDGMVEFPFNPTEVLSQFQSIFPVQFFNDFIGRLNSLFKLPSLFSPADMRISENGAKRVRNENIAIQPPMLPRILEAPNNNPEQDQ